MTQKEKSVSTIISPKDASSKMEDRKDAKRKASFSGKRRRYPSPRRRSDTVIRGYQPVTEDMVLGFDAYEGDTSRALSQRPEIQKLWIDRIVSSFEAREFDSDEKYEAEKSKLLSRLPRMVRAKVRLRLLKRRK
ncbi:hypothetical protein Pan153_55900 [Gimesia panareensis]|uniref:Uncharacterized protein n=1 Tax=Gimesia panareensis TaxID=2527978 RepID=A0A518FXC9_9PLAN|nr:hypothetical protein [Gimesia panareensis]QDV20910.1 hypothetical protein Pan153_55900 [Gimesia panareensis]